jgi:hypothetical protein
MSISSGVSKSSILQVDRDRIIATARDRCEIWIDASPIAGCNTVSAGS